MKKIFKNPVENTDGTINCIEIHPVYGEIPHTQDPSCEYILYDELGVGDWAEIKPCPQEDKDAHTAQLAKASMERELAKLDLPVWKLARAIAGDEQALAEVLAAEEKKNKIRG